MTSFKKGMTAMLLALALSLTAIVPDTAVLSVSAASAAPESAAAQERAEVEASAINATESESESEEESSAEETTQTPEETEPSTEGPTEPELINLENASIAIALDAYTYTGSAIKPAVTVTLDGTTLVKNTDFKVTYANCTNVGTAEIKITGIGSYTGTAARTFKITARKISTSNTEVKLSSTKTSYTGKERKPSVKSVVLSFTKNGTAVKLTLAEGKDYTVSYKDNVEPGKASVVLKGKGNFAGSFVKKFNIVPEKGSGLKIGSTSSSKVTLTADEPSSKDTKFNWLIKKKTDGKWVKLASKNTSKNKVTFSDLDAAEKYLVYVRYYYKDDDGTFMGAYSGKLLVVTSPATPVITSAKKDSSSLKVTWKAVSKATGYQVTYATKSDFSDAKSVYVAGRSKTSTTISDVGSSGYIAKVRAYYTVNGERYFGAYSGTAATEFGYTLISYTTTHSSNTDRNVNLSLACGSINGTVLSPGETFNYNQIVGERTAARGYRYAIIFSGGKEIMGLGGGVCQVATTIYNCALRSNMKILERHQHSKRVYYCPRGYDAAIYWGKQNVRFTNTLDTTVKIKASTSYGDVTMTMYTSSPVDISGVKTWTTTSGSTTTLYRSYNGVINYTTKSTY